MKKIFLFLMIAFFAINAKSQELLNASKSEIKKAMTANGGVLRDDEMGQDFESKPYNILSYKFPESIAKSNGVALISFFLTAQNKCYKYVTSYASDKYLKALVNKFDNHNSGFKRLGKGLDWSNLRGDEVHLLTIPPANNATHGKFTPFLLETKLKGIK